MSGMARKLASLASRAAARARVWVREMRDRLRLTRMTAGARMVLPPRTEPIRPSRCCACGGLAARTVAPDRALRASWGRPPPLQISLCEPCGETILRYRRFEWLVALVGGACSAIACTGVFFFAPWSAWPWLALASAVACAAALLVRLLRAPVLVGTTGWKGVPARWVSRAGEDWVLATPSLVLCDALQDAAGGPSRQQRLPVLERDGRALLFAGLLAVSGSPLLWRTLHPEVRIINLGARPVQVFVDGRWAGLVHPTWSEAPNIGIVIRAPVGDRSFEAREETGARIDFVRGWVAHDLPVVYAPAHQPFCLWIEQRIYGTAPSPGPAVLKLPQEETLYRLPFAPDAWFQPNPGAISRDRWFSGGLRRTLRFGPCASSAAP
jgi:hypothetical protein